MKKLLMIFLVTGFIRGNALAHGDPKKPAARKTTIEEKAFGREGDPKKVTRIISMDMSDAMRYSPMEITVKRGETVRLIAKNSGKVLHEMVLGTMAELREYFELMKKFPDMEHDEPHMAHVKPCQSCGNSPMPVSSTMAA